MISLQPGTYEIGREDGSIEPFIVKVGVSNQPLSGTARSFDLYCASIQDEAEGWWFRWLEPPDMLPVSVEGWEIHLPPAPR